MRRLPLERPPELTALLRPGERLIWWDRPYGGGGVAPPEALILAAVFVLLTISVAGLAGGWRHGPQWPLIPFVGTALAIPVLLLVLVLRGAWWRGVVYGLTTARVLMVAPSGTTAVDLDRVVAVRRRGRRDNPATVIVEAEASPLGTAPGTPLVRLVLPGVQWPARTVEAILGAKARRQAGVTPSGMTWDVPPRVG